MFSFNIIKLQMIQFRIVTLTPCPQNTENAEKKINTKQKAYAPVWRQYCRIPSVMTIYVFIFYSTSNDI